MTKKRVLDNFYDKKKKGRFLSDSTVGDRGTDDVDGVFCHDDVLTSGFENAHDGGGVLLVILHKEFFFVFADANKGFSLWGTNRGDPVIHQNGTILDDGQS